MSRADRLDSLISQYEASHGDSYQEHLAIANDNNRLIHWLLDNVGDAPDQTLLGFVKLFKESKPAMAGIMSIAHENSLTTDKLTTLFESTGRNTDDFSELMLSGEWRKVLSHSAAVGRTQQHAAQYFAKHRISPSTRKMADSAPRLHDWIARSVPPELVEPLVKVSAESPQAIISLMDIMENHKLHRPQLQHIYASSDSDIHQFLETMITGRWKALRNPRAHGTLFNDFRRLLGLGGD